MLATHRMYKTSVVNERPMRRCFRDLSKAGLSNGLASPTVSLLELFRTSGRAGRPVKYLNRYSPPRMAKTVKETAFIVS